MTDDTEREALARIIEDGFEKPDEHHATADAILAAGFRRSEVPEPSDPARITIEHEGGNTVTGTLDEVLNHGHLKPGWRYRRAEPQGEPSDAQALLTIRDDIVRNGGRADAAVLAGLEALALRAAGEVR